jgi:CRP/FNR family cyclic AMP-dependent transcriptional regulator
MNVFDPTASKAGQRLLRLAELGRVRQHAKSTVLIEEAGQGQQVLVLLKGRLRVYTESSEGRQYTLALVDPVDLVGEMSLDGGARSASVLTMEASTCAHIDREALLHYMASEPEFAMDLLCRVIARARLATQQAGSLALLDAYHRLSLWLDKHAVPEGDPGPWRTAQVNSQTDLAQQLGCSREMISRLIKDLQIGGHLQLAPGRWRVKLPLPRAW